MALDTSIPLAGNTNLPLQSQAPQEPDLLTNASNAQGVQMNQMKIDAAKVDMQKQLAIGDMYKKADMSTPEGRAKLVNEMWKVAPDAAQEQEKYDIDQKYKQKQTEHQDVQIKKAFVDMDNTKFEQQQKLSAKYNDAVANLKQMEDKAPPAQKEKIFQVYRAQLMADPEIPQEIKQGLPAKYDSNWLASTAIRSEKYSTLLKEAEQERHNKVEEGLRGAEVRQQANVIEKAVDPVSGEQKYDIINKNTGEVKSTEAGWKDKTTAGGQSMRIQAANQNTLRASKEASSALDTIVGMDNPSTGIFGADPHGGFEGFTKQIGTTAGQKKYAATTATLGKELAIQESPNKAPSEAQIETATKSITILPDDDLQTAQFKTALAARAAKNSVKAALDFTNPGDRGYDALKEEYAKWSKYPEPNQFNKNWKAGQMFSDVKGDTDEGTKYEQPKTGKSSLDSIFGGSDTTNDNTGSKKTLDSIFGGAK